MNNVASYKLSCYLFCVLKCALTTFAIHPRYVFIPNASSFCIIYFVLLIILQNSGVFPLCILYYDASSTVFKILISITLTYLSDYCCSICQYRSYYTYNKFAILSEIFTVPHKIIHTACSFDRFYNLYIFSSFSSCPKFDISKLI